MGNKRGKRYREFSQKVPGGKVGLPEAIRIIKDFKSPRFDPTVELVIHLGIDPKHADQAIRGAMALPHGIGRARKVIAFCDGPDAVKAKEAGAIEAGGDDLIKKIRDGWMDFDVAITMPAMMPKVSKLGRILGPQGKMPSPKAGTVVEDVAAAVAEYAAGKAEFRNDDGGNLHVSVGKISFEDDKLLENIEAFISHIKRLRPSAAKGAYIKKACLSATMSPSVQLDV